MRPALALLLLTAFLALPLHASEVSFRRVWPGWKDENAFKTIREYFKGKEDSGGWIIARTHPEKRKGYYFVAHVDNAGAAQPKAVVVIQVITPESPETKQFRLGINLPTGSKILELGLTGTDWTGPLVNPVAWKVELFGDDGSLLASENSFLWEKPVR